MYLYGYGTEQDYKKALKCFRESTKLCDNDTALFFSEIVYVDKCASYTEEYLKKVDMFERMTEELDLEEIYELGLIYYHGVKYTSDDTNKYGTQIIINPDHGKSSRYFRIIVKEQLSGNIGQK
jgi:TPR repeat protein